MTDNPTGPDLFTMAEDNYQNAAEAGEEGDNEIYGSLQERYHFQAATIRSRQAQTAALVMIAEILCAAHRADHYELDAWREVIPLSPLKECKGQNTRRPECAERHTEDCTYADPIPEPKHVLLPVGTRVLVSERATHYPDGRIVYDKQPRAAKIVGHVAGGSKYQLNYEKTGGGYYDFVMYAFADNRVQPHPEQDGTVAEPTGPRLYVQHLSGKQGHVVDVASMNGELMFRVQWYTPGSGPVWKAAGSLTIIPADQVERCENGQTGDECGSGENQCELCLAAEDAEAEAIERSMGV